MTTLDQVSHTLHIAEVQLLAAAVYQPKMAQRILTQVQPEELEDEGLQMTLQHCHKLFAERDGLSFGALAGLGAPGAALRAIQMAKMDVTSPFAPDALQGFLGARAAKRIHRLLSSAREELASLGSCEADDLHGLGSGLDIAIREEAERIAPLKRPALILDLMRDAYQERRKKAKATYGILAIDNHTGGLRKGTLHVVGGPSGGGKSAMALTAALESAKAGERVLYVTKEMNSRECAFRMASMLSGMTEHEITHQPWGNTAAMIEALVPSELVFADDMRTVLDIKAAVHRAAIMGEPYGLVVVDYLQQYRIRRGSKSNPVEEIDEAVEVLKGIAMQRQCAVLTPAQLNRSVDTGSLANTEHLRGSGGIEQWADAVVTLRGTDDVRQISDHRPGGGGSGSYRIMQAAVRKARNGQVGVLWGDEKEGAINIGEPLKFGLGTFRFWDSKSDPWDSSAQAQRERDIKANGSYREEIQ